MGYSRMLRCGLHILCACVLMLLLSIKLSDEYIRRLYMNCRSVPCNISPFRPRDQRGSVRSFSIGAYQTRWFLGAKDAGFRESSPNDVVDGGMSSRSSHRPSACQRVMSPWSTTSPHWHRCGAKRVSPRRYPAATLTA